MQHTNAIQLNLKKIVKPDVQERNHFQQHCDAGDFFWKSFSGYCGDDHVLSALLSCHLLFIVVGFCVVLFSSRSFHLLLLFTLLLTFMCHFLKRLAV